MTNSTDVFMARQPIFDRKKQLVAYELLYRSGFENRAGNVGPEESARSLVSSIADFGLLTLSGGKTAFINIDEAMLATDAPFMLPRDQVVLEILEDLEATADNVRAVDRLAQAGYQIALDDFDPARKASALAPVAKILKWDVLAHGSRLPANVKEYRRPGLAMLAEKIETREQFEMCKALGAQFFQGYYFAKPEILHSHTIPSNKLLALEIVAKLQDTTLGTGQLEQLVSRDLALTHRLLKMVHSAHMGLGIKVSSVRQAIFFLGVRTVGALASLLALSAESTAPDELLVTSLVRAKACEELARAAGAPKPERFFTVGLLSVIDAVLSTPMKLLLEQLPLSEEINEALLHPEGDSELSKSLRSIMHFEQGDWAVAANDASLEEINAAYRKAIIFANATGGSCREDEAAA